MRELINTGEALDHINRELEESRRRVALDKPMRAIKPDDGDRATRRWWSRFVVLLKPFKRMGPRVAGSYDHPEPG